MKKNLTSHKLAWSKELNQNFVLAKSHREQFSRVSHSLDDIKIGMEFSGLVAANQVSKYDSEAGISNNKITEGRNGWNEASKRYNDLLLEKLRMHSTPWNSGSIGNTISAIKPVSRCILHRFYLRKKRFNRQGWEPNAHNVLIENASLGKLGPSNFNIRAYKSAHITSIHML